MSKAKHSESSRSIAKNPGLNEWADLQRLIKYQFNDLSLLQQALTHKSAHNKHNERLEFLGDAILGAIIADYLYTRFPESPEGKLTRMRSAVVKGDTLAEIALKQGLGEYIKLGPGELKSGGKRRSSILADSVEAIIGAIYLDAGQQQCVDFIHDWFSEHMQRLDPEYHPKDAKTRLQEYLQAYSHDLPLYEVVAVTGKDHNQTFTVSCTTSLLEQSVTADGPSRKRAEQLAAQYTLEKIHA